MSMLGTHGVAEFKEAAPESLKKLDKELAYLRHALDQSAIVAVTDQNGVITDVNDAFCQLSKYSRSELIGQTHRVVNSGYHPPGFFEQMWKTIKSGAIWRGEIKNRAKDGSYYWVATTIVPSLDETGRPFQYIAIRHDITERMIAREELAQLNEGLEQRIAERTEALEEADRQKSKILSFVAHDLKTSLASIMRFADIMLAEEDLTPTQQELTGYIAQGVDQLRELVSNILDRARMDEGQIKPDPKWIELAPFLEGLKPCAQGLADQKEITVRFEIRPGLDGVYADPTHLRQILANLFSNAVKYNHRGGKVFIRCYPTPGGHWTVIEVEDTGVGIPAEKIPQIFAEYYRSDLSSTNAVEGSGLGLAFTRKLVELQCGQIAVESQEGKGSTFRVSLPVLVRHHAALL